MTDKAWLDGLKIGDMVAGRYGDNGLFISRVTGRDARGKDGTILVGERRINARTGHENSKVDFYAQNVATIEPVTDLIRAEMLARKNRAKLRKVDLSKLDDSTVAQILEILYGKVQS